MSDKKTPAIGAPVDVLWFDKDGCGPDVLSIQPWNFRAEMGGRIPATLGLRIMKTSESMSLPLMNGAARAMVEGGFVLDRESAQQLAKSIDDWLERTAEPDDGKVGR